MAGDAHDLTIFEPLGDARARMAGIEADRGQVDLDLTAQLTLGADAKQLV